MEVGNVVQYCSLFYRTGTDQSTCKLLIFKVFTSPIKQHMVARWVVREFSV